MIFVRFCGFLSRCDSEAGNVVVESFKESHGNFPNSATRIVRRWKWLIGECLLCKCWTLRNENSVWSVWSPWSKAFLLFVLSGLPNILLLKSNLSCKGKPDVPMQPSWPCFSVNFQICVPGRILAFILDTYLGFYASLSKINILRSPQRSPLTRSSLPVHTFHNNSLISDQVQVQHWADECLESKVGQECQQAPRDTWSGLHSCSNQLVASQSHPHKGLFH